MRSRRSRGPAWHGLAILAVLSATAFAEPLVLAPERPIERPLRRGETIQTQVRLKAYEYISFHIKPDHLAIEVRIVDPRGDLVQTLTPFERETDVTLANDIAGDYTISITGSARVPGPPAGSFKIDHYHHLTAQERVDGMTALTSARIAKLEDQLKANDPDAVRVFWADVKRLGTPLVEPLKDDPYRMAVTFVWRGDGDTQNVVVGLWPFMIGRQDELKMEHIPGTDVWFRTLKLARDLRCTYDIAVNVPAPWKDDAMDVIFAAGVVDPLNPHARVADPHLPRGARFQTRSILEMPDAPKQEWTQAQPRVAKGRVTETTLASDRLRETELLSVYTPAGYSDTGEPASLFILFDRLEYTTFVPTPTILDNLIAHKKIPPTVAVLIEFPEPQNESRTRQLTCNPAFSDFLQLELLPWIRKHYRVKSDPQHLVIGGSSFGGLAAVCAGLHHPDTFQNILSQSGSFWWTKEFNRHFEDEHAPPADPDRELADVMKRFIETPKLPLRLYMEAGSLEIDLAGHGFDLLSSGRHLRDVLLAKGYDVTWHQFRGGHDYLSWRGSLADGLIVLDNEPAKR